MNVELRSGRPGLPGASIDIADVLSWRASDSGLRDDALAVEEPLEIRFGGCSVAVTMRTPGDDVDLALGFLFTEGIIRSTGDIATIAYCADGDAASDGNIINLNPTDPGIVDPARWTRHFYTTSSCGVCGKASIDAVFQDAPPLDADLGMRMAPDTIVALDTRLREAQAVFGRTGGLHAAALCDPAGNLLAVREDVGRHNAVDKVIGSALQGGSRFKVQGSRSNEPGATAPGRTPGMQNAELGTRNQERGTRPSERRTQNAQLALVVSGRASFEIVQKALMARIPIVAAVSAPSSLAVELARLANMTLIGFLRSGRFNVYSHPDRILAGSTLTFTAETQRTQRAAE